MSQGPPTLPHTSRDARHLNALDFRFRVGCAAVDSSLSTAVVLGLPSPSVRLTLTAAAAHCCCAAAPRPITPAAGQASGTCCRAACAASLRTALYACCGAWPVPRFFLGPAAAARPAACLRTNKLYPVQNEMRLHYCNTSTPSMNQL